jgi:hypothetical protein
MTNAGMLAEDNFSYADDLQALPLVLDEDGMSYLQEDGFLQEDFLQENDFDYNVGYFPEFGM